MRHEGIAAEDNTERESPLMANLYLMGEQVERLEKTVMAMAQQLRPVTCDTPTKALDTDSEPSPPMSEANLRIQMLTRELDRLISRMQMILAYVEV